MNLKSQNKYICIYIFKYLNLNHNILPKHSDIRNYSTGNNNNFIAQNVTSKSNIKKSEMSTYFKGIKVWNKLPADIRTSDSLYVFMDNLRNYCLSRY